MALNDGICDTVRVLEYRHFRTKKNGIITVYQVLFCERQLERASIAKINPKALVMINYHFYFSCNRDAYEKKRKIFPQDSEKDPNIDYTDADAIYSFSSPVIVNVSSKKK